MYVMVVKRKEICKFEKHYYAAKKAHAEYELELSEAREGIPLNKIRILRT